MVNVKVKGQGDGDDHGHGHGHAAVTVTAIELTKCILPTLRRLEKLMSSELWMVSGFPSSRNRMFV